MHFQTLRACVCVRACVRAYMSCVFVCVCGGGGGLPRLTTKKNEEVEWEKKKSWLVI